MVRDKLGMGIALYVAILSMVGCATTNSEAESAASGALPIVGSPTLEGRSAEEGEADAPREAQETAPSVEPVASLASPELPAQPTNRRRRACGVAVV